MAEDLEHIQEIAIEVVQEAGAYLLENRGKVHPEEVDEKSSNDFVTVIDKTSEKLIIERIKKHFPAHTILAEEGGRQGKNSAYEWVIDPLDGTKNYIRDIPYFCVSIAVFHQNKPVVGVVYDPVHDELFQAVKGGGSFLNRRPIRVSNASSLNRCMLTTGFPHRSKAYLPQYLQAFEEIFIKCIGIRRPGSAALDLCHTACGRYDAFWELGLSSWDIAAGSLIVAEAGGVVSDFWGNPTYLKSGFIIAGNAEIHKNLQEILSYHFNFEKTPH